MLEPPALKPLIGPRILLPLALTVALIFHFIPTGWSPIGNGVEGETASCARRLFETGTWLVDGKMPDAPLMCWLVKLSFGVFGVTEFGARAPVAGAVMLVVLFVFLLAERLGGSWRGFVASMILLCSPGLFTIARMLSSGPVFTAMLTAAFYCAYRAFEIRNTRCGWLACFWICIAAACAAGGFRALLYPALVIALMSACYREARIRFKALVSPEGVALFAVALALAWMHGGAPSGRPTPVLRFAALQPVWLFPWSILLLGPLLYALGRLLQGRPLEFYEAFPLGWMASAFAIGLVDPARQNFSALPVWAGFAVWAAVVLDITARRSVLASLMAILALAIGGLLQHPAARAFFSFAPRACAVFLALAAAALVLEWQNRRKPALLALFAGMMFLGGGLIDHAARRSEPFSLAGVAHYLTSKAKPESAVFFAGTAHQCSGLGFYLDTPFATIEPRSGKLTELLQRRSPVYLITTDGVPGREPILQSGRYSVFTNASQTTPP